MAFPEIWAAVDSKGVPWPTISGTVGHIENAHDWFAIIVVGVLVWGVFHAFRVNFSRAPTVGPGHPAPSDEERVSTRVFRTPGGRLSRTPDVKPLSRWGLYFVVALVVVIGGSLSTHLLDPGAHWLLGQVLYGLIVVTMIVVPGLFAYRGRLVPFPTLFRTIQYLEARMRTVAIVLAAGITVLLIHLVLYPWPSVIPDLQGIHSYCHPANRPPPDDPICKEIIQYPTVSPGAP